MHQFIKYPVIRITGEGTPRFKGKEGGGTGGLKRKDGGAGGGESICPRKM